MSSYDVALRRFTDEDGLILERPNNSPGPETGNGIHGLCVATQIRQLRGELKPSHVILFKTVIESCQVEGPSPNGMTLIPIPGLYHRGPRKTEELIAHDDYRALSAVSSQIGAGFNKDIDHYGQANGWNFNNLNPSKWTFRSWHRRYPGVVPTYKILGGIEPWPQEIDSIKTCFWFAQFGSSPGGHILKWLEASALRGRLPLIDSAIEIWSKGMLKRFGSLSGLMRAYYTQSDGSLHPFAEFTEGCNLYR